MWAKPVREGERTEAALIPEMLSASSSCATPPHSPLPCCPAHLGQAPAPLGTALFPASLFPAWRPEALEQTLHCCSASPAVGEGRGESGTERPVLAGRRGQVARGTRAPYAGNQGELWAWELTWAPSVVRWRVVGRCL